jgi:beta-glucosidase
LTLMSGFNDLNGVPATGNELILRQILKTEWGFPGFVVSDWASMTEMIPHGLCESAVDVAQVSARAGVDMEMASRAYIDHLPGLVERGLVPMELVDDAVRRILTVKARLGLFDNPYTEPPSVSSKLSKEHLAVARLAARNSIVLLKNDGATLPLKHARKIAVLGPLADDANEQLGCWAFDGSRADAVTPLAALRERLGARVQLEHVKGVDDCRSTDTSGIAEAVRAAESSDVTLLFVGEPANLSGECRSRAFLDLPGIQQELVERVARTGKPLVLVVMAGRPLTIGRACELSQAVVYAWHLGTMAGPALADILLGDVAPSGKLPLCVPRTVGQVPIYYSYKNTGRPPKRDTKQIPMGTPLDPVDFDASYLDVEVSPEFPFGFGLSYTTFQYGEVRLSSSKIKQDETLVVRAQVTNTGAVEGEEVVQLYVRDLVGSVTRPVRELKGFQRVRLRPRATQTVEFRLASRDLAFHGKELKFEAERGKFQVFVGGDSRAPLGAEFELE